MRWLLFIFFSYGGVPVTVQTEVDSAKRCEQHKTEILTQAKNVTVLLRPAVIMSGCYQLSE